MRALLWGKLRRHGALRRLALGVVAATTSLLSAAPALGATFCVDAPGCTGTQKPGVQQALHAANSNGTGADIIRVGPGTYHGPFTDNSGNPVRLIGARGHTVFDDPSGSTSSSQSTTLTISEPTSSFSSFTVVVPSGDLGTGISSSGKLDYVLVRDVASDTDDVGVWVRGGSLSHSRIVLAGSPSGNGYYLPTTGIETAGFIQDDLVHMLAAGARGIEAAGDSTTEARQLTLVGPGDTASGTTDKASRGVSLDPLSGVGSSNDTVVLDGVIIRGFAHALVADGSQTPNPLCAGDPTCTLPPYDNVATIEVSYSDFNPSNDIVADQDSYISKGSGDINVDPGFNDPGAGDYSLRGGSALIDHGDPAVPRAASTGHPADSTIDLAGHPRKSDGNGDGTAIVDIGAYEYRLPCIVPKLRDKLLSAAKTALERARCTLGQLTRQHSSQIGKGRVISSKPSAGTHLPTGAPVAVTVSRGP